MSVQTAGPSSWFVIEINQSRLTVKKSGLSEKKKLIQPHDIRILTVQYDYAAML